MIKLSIVIGTYNRYMQLKQCLESLIGKVKASHEIIVIDAGSNDETIEYLKNLNKKPGNNLKLIFEKERTGQAKSLNRVFKTLTSQYTCWLSDDNVVINNILDKTISILNDNFNIGMAALKVKDAIGQFKDAEYIGGIWISGILNVNQGMIRTELMHKIGYFDESYVDYGIDADLTVKVLLAGYNVVYTKEIGILHYRDHDTGAMNQNIRKERFLKAKEIYNSKYNYLSQNSIIKQSLFRFFFKLFYSLCTKYFNIFRQYNKRDIYNCTEAKFISYFDLIRSLFKDYYLVQSLPGKYIQKIK